MIAIPTFERAAKPVLVEVRRHQRDVHINDERLGGRRYPGALLAGQLPHPSPRRGRAASIAARIAIVRDTGGSEATRPNAWLGAQHSDIGQAVPTQRQRHRQIANDLGWIMSRGRLAPTAETD
jgi:hypothetical protein